MCYKKDKLATSRGTIEGYEEKKKNPPSSSN
jgi:hypothetical protein